MTTLRTQTLLPTVPEQAFDLALDLQEHTRSAAATCERVLRTTAEGPMKLGDEVTFEARHLGLRWKLTARITLHEPPYAFVDEQTRGPFRVMRHEHRFESHPEGTVMTDLFTFAAPNVLFCGKLIERLIVGPHLTRFLRTRAEALRRAAEDQSRG